MTKTTTAKLPRTIIALIAETEAVGGEVIEVQPRLFEVVLPCRVVGGEIRMVVRASVGYYVREDGKNHIRGMAEAREEIAYWGRQSRR